MSRMVAYGVARRRLAQTMRSSMPRHTTTHSLVTMGAGPSSTRLGIDGFPVAVRIGMVECAKGKMGRWAKRGVWITCHPLVPCCYSVLSTLLLLTLLYYSAPCRLLILRPLPRPPLPLLPLPLLLLLLFLFSSSSSSSSSSSTPPSQAAKMRGRDSPRVAFLVSDESGTMLTTFVLVLILAQLTAHTSHLTPHT